MVINQYAVCLVNLDPTIGSEIRKTRPCVVISPDVMNRYLRTVQIAPMTSNSNAYPWRAPIRFQNKRGMVAMDQLRTVDKRRIVKILGTVPQDVQDNIKGIIQEMLVD